MLQTDRKTDQTRQTSQDREQTRQQKRDSENRSSAVLALEAILTGGSWDQLPADGVLSLSHTLGNGALLELYAMRNTGPETLTDSVPRGTCATAPVEWAGGAPLLAEGPTFGAMGPMGAAAPMEL